MPIKVSFNRTLGVRIHQVRGRVTAAEFLALLAFYREHPHLARFDLINLVDEGAETEISAAELSQLREAFVQLQAHVRPFLVRRSAWVCPNVRAWPVLESWLHGRHSRDAMHIEVCLVAELAEADCLFDAIELAAVRDWAGFEEIALFEDEARAAEAHQTTRPANAG